MNKTGGGRWLSGRWFSGRWLSGAGILLLVAVRLLTESNVRRLRGHFVEFTDALPGKVEALLSPLVEKHTDVGLRGENTSRAVVIDHGEPFSFYLRKNATASSRIVVSSAIAVPEENIVVFIVHEMFDGNASERTFALPDKYACDFQLAEASVHTKLEMYATAEVLYRTTSLWKCDLPRARRLATNQVRMRGPDWKVNGSDVFPLAQSRPPLANLTACVKPVKNLTRGGQTHERLREYMNHYTALGVEHFILYINREVEDSSILSELPNVTIVRMSPNLHWRTFGSVPRKNMVQVYFNNDCVWRTRHRSAWTMVQFDLDEFVINTGSTPKTIRSHLDNLDANVSQLYFPHSLVRPPFGEPLVRDSITYSSSFMPTWGKVVVRPEKVNVQWVHSATSYSGTKVSASNMRLLHFQFDHFEKHQKWLALSSWTTYRK